MEAFAPLRVNWEGVSKFLENEQGYACYYDTFRTTPTDWSSHFPNAERERMYRGGGGEEEGKFKDKRDGALSYNWICHHKEGECGEVVKGVPPQLSGRL